MLEHGLLGFGCKSVKNTSEQKLLPICRIFTGNSKLFSRTNIYFTMTPIDKLKADLLIFAPSLINQAALKRINALKSHLEQPETEKEYMHRIRVDIKHLRAWLKLTKTGSKDSDSKAIDKRLHKVAKTAGIYRDIHVTAEILQNLLDEENDHKKKTAIKILQDQLIPITSALEWTTARSNLMEDLDLLKKRCDVVQSNYIIINNLDNTYRKLLKHGKKAYSKQGNHNELHKLRMWVKYLFYQLGYIEKALPEHKIKQRTTVKTLGNELGKVHDLVMTENTIKQMNVEKKNIDVVCKIINKYILDYINQSKITYKIIFHLSSEQFFKQLGLDCNDTNIQI